MLANPQMCAFTGGTAAQTDTPALRARHQLSSIGTGAEVTELSGATGKTEPNEQELAYHQAGQAVICVTLFGARVVKNLGLSDGRVVESQFETYSRLPVPLSCRPPSHRRGEDRKPIEVEGIVDAHGVLTYSGIAAVFMHFRNLGHPEDLDYRTAYLGTREALAKLASSIGLERPVDQFYDEYWDEACRLLTADWDAVERVAEGLLTLRSLNGNRVDALVLGEELQ